MLADGARQAVSPVTSVASSFHGVVSVFSSNNKCIFKNVSINLLIKKSSDCEIIASPYKLVIYVFACEYVWTICE